MGKRTEFLYLSEPDCIAAGVLDAKKCVDNAEEVFRLLAKGDYLMGGAGRNSHGLPLVFRLRVPSPACRWPDQTAVLSQCPRTSAAALTCAA